MKDRTRWLLLKLLNPNLWVSQRYGAWYLVLLAVLMTIGFALACAMSVWCITNGHGTFTGGFVWVDFGFELRVHCTN
ncbi:hypothetical protein D2E26_0239 [Bifidobacterium dolichotidis]|uniref:Uncharacterized protein n=1 Tax=Bifidobacterium dolichotidis TaxID=2306976 RepID=A0A430FS16_9BIFI|nr:hypothetical protein [Bifidobacterium dolichotidis]RSX55676.1 hypothetical protein D2E26_0239 [Bifidobacterium dolichotidis]